MNRLQEKAGKVAVGLIAVGMVAGSIAGCVTPPSDPAARAEFEQINDPLEPLNRYFFELNRMFDFLLIHPWADTYRLIVPEFGRKRVHNALDNLSAPMDVINDALQGRATDGVTTVGRFVVNSTLGAGGLFDVATDFGLAATDADFGQTLHVWGLPEGPYLVLPMFGPSNPRDAAGMVAEMFGDPIGWTFKLNDLSMVNDGLTGMGAIDKRAEFIEPLESLEKSSIDFYAQMRSMSRQHRAKQLGIEGVSSPTYPSFDFYDEPGASVKPGVSAKPGASASATPGVKPSPKAIPKPGEKPVPRPGSKPDRGDD